MKINLGKKISKKLFNAPNLSLKTTQKSYYSVKQKEESNKIIAFLFSIKHLYLPHQSHTPHKFLPTRQPHHIEISTIW